MLSRISEYVLTNRISMTLCSIKHWRKHGGAPPEGVGQAVGQAAAILRKAEERKRRGGFGGRGTSHGGPGGRGSMGSGGRGPPPGRAGAFGRGEGSGFHPGSGGPSHYSSGDRYGGAR